MKEKTGNRIILFSFALTVFVIWLHAGECLISSIPGQIAVPGFFILSGFLFFRGIISEDGAQKAAVGSEGGKNGFLPVRMKEKLKRRVRTLLIPYLLWNFLYFVIYLICGKAEPKEFFSAVFLYSCNPVFWYLQQLILIKLIAPLLYFIMKKRIPAVIWLAFIFILAVLYDRIHSVVDIRFINEDALFYYSLGAFLSLHIRKEAENSEETGIPEVKMPAPEIPETGSAPAETPGMGTSLTETDAAETSGEKRPLRTFFAEWKNVLITAGILLVFDLLSCILPDVIKNIGVIGLRTSGVLLVWLMIGKLPEVKIFPWMRITFFIYATHYMVIRLVWALETAMGLNGSAFANAVTYLIMPAVCTAAAYGLYILMKKLTPKLLEILTGGRGI